MARRPLAGAALPAPPVPAPPVPSEELEGHRRPAGSSEEREGSFLSLVMTLRSGRAAAGLLVPLRSHRATAGLLAPQRGRAGAGSAPPGVTM